jgi:hypothetical protein
MEADSGGSAGCRYRSAYRQTSEMGHGESEIYRSALRHVLPAAAPAMRRTRGAAAKKGHAWLIGLALGSTSN